MKKWMAAVLVILLVCSVVGCGNKDVATDVEVSADTTIVETTESTSESSNEEVVTNEETTEESIASEEATPESTEEPVEELVEELVEESTLESAETPTETQAEVPAEQPTETSVSYTYTDLDETMYAKQSVNVRSMPCKDGEKLGGLNLNDEVRVTGQCVETSWYRIAYNDGIGYVSNNYLAKEKTVTASNNPENSTNDSTTTPSQPTQPSSGSGDDLSFSGSLTLPSGITISTLNKFNYAGMVLNSETTSWMGDKYSDIVAQNYAIMGQNFDKFNEANVGSINVVSSEKIWWRISESDASGVLTIQKCNDHYKLIITSPCLDSNTAQAMGQVLIDKNVETMAQEALTTLLSTITSTPLEAKNALISTLYTAPNGQEPILPDGNYHSIGDCKIKLGAYNTKDGNYAFVFMIKP